MLSMFSSHGWIGMLICCRLLELAPAYFDVSGFPDGETKRALIRVQDKRSGKSSGGGGSGRGRNVGTSSQSGREAKRRKM